MAKVENITNITHLPNAVLIADTDRQIKLIQAAREGIISSDQMIDAMRDPNYEVHSTNFEGRSETGV